MARYFYFPGNFLNRQRWYTIIFRLHDLTVGKELSVSHNFSIAFTFRDRFMVLMVLIMDRHEIPTIGITPGSSNGRSSKASFDVFNDDIRRT